VRAREWPILGGGGLASEQAPIGSIRVVIFAICAAIAKPSRVKRVLTRMNTTLRAPVTDLLPLAKVAAALREITEVLAREVSAPTAEPPLWDKFEWRIALAVAAIQGMSSILRERLRWTGPEYWRRFLDEQHEHIVGRCVKIERLLTAIDSHARSEGVAVVALKGASLLKRGIYAAGERPMADIDLLVRAADVGAVTRLLTNCGFELTFSTWRHQLFESRLGEGSTTAGLGEHVDNPIKIELHTSIRERLPVSEADITQFVFPVDPHAGVNDYPTASSLMMHLLLHAAGNIRAHALRLIQLQDIARLAARFGPGDWEELLAARPNDQGLWWAAAPLSLTARYYPTAIPKQILVPLTEECPWLLRHAIRHQRLADVSWCNPRVYAFPGIEWCRSPQETVRFVASRVWPSRDARSELSRFAARHPGASEIPWYGISQGARVVRWIFSRPPRVQALLPVRAALALRCDETARRSTSG
jgi:hypothetical protein